MVFASSSHYSGFRVVHTDGAHALAIAIQVFEDVFDDIV